ncbi:elongation factor 4 [Candidatus Roizmanbacteria bacterium CG17_big_fil_post_rev_8_21_14_2_50_39_7]|uniref:Elongation factor 4 n=1 Tax=Candidatus Roizmanbacteria bacterium CG17_big_fil_post_rev_8_21_14_2_50_39_7 TaxID=1974858 RepID=A0A2M7EKB5_9BACT|nr:MAG: elongation factor 4 [Candidatus Roizmanbacteria bacterium CG17_big_fil_post_rev_8_21_14_2_50_39_7]
MQGISKIRNFAIIAHVDHGKSTLADRLLEITGVVSAGKHEEQMLDRNPVSRERGITIKLAPVKMLYSPTVIPAEAGIQSKMHSNGDYIDSRLRGNDKQEYILNLIDTPGHVDFSYEVDRTLACVEGVVLLVDATQGIQAQTIANAYKALEKNLVIIPVINKIDMDGAEIEKTQKQIIDFLGVKPEEIFKISAKTGMGVQKVLDAVIEKIPAPALLTHNTQHVTSHIKGQKEMLHVTSYMLQALIFDSYYDTHKGVIAFVRVFGGSLKRGMEVKMAHEGGIFIVSEVGMFKPDLTPTDELKDGEIGYVATNLKDIHAIQIGDTMQLPRDETPPLPGYKKVKPMVYASIFPTDTNDYLNFKKALEKLYLTDSALDFSGIYSTALGAGFRVGFLGLLHADVVRERLEREYELSLVLTPPQVEFKIEDGKFYEPIVKIFIYTPESYTGAVMKVCEEHRAKFITMDNTNQIALTYEMPLAELITNFFDRLKSMTSGYASLDWEILRYEYADANKMELLINNDPVEEFSEIVVTERAQEKSQFLTKRLKDLIPRQQFDIKIQAKYKGKIIASERISPFRKNVLMHKGKLVGGGDVGRKNKLLEKQKEGKKLMKSVGRVEIPKDAFMKLFNKQ